MELNEWGHDQLLDDLHQHLDTDAARMLWKDTPMGPSGSVRPDIYSLKKSFSNPQATAYEIKISVSDYRSDVTSGKWQNYLQFASAVIFCVPHGLINKHDLPDGCGLMTRSDKGWRTAKKPTYQPFPAITQDVWLKLLMKGEDKALRAMQQQFKQFPSHQESRELRKNLAADVREYLKDKEHAQFDLDQMRGKVKTDKEWLAKAWQEFKDVTGCDTRWGIKAKIAELEGESTLTPSARRNIRSLQSNIAQLVDELSV